MNDTTRSTTSTDTPAEHVSPAKTRQEYLEDILKDLKREKQKLEEEIKNPNLSQEAHLEIQKQMTEKERQMTEIQKQITILLKSL